jgi:hypothetical protein
MASNSGSGGSNTYHPVPGSVRVVPQHRWNLRRCEGGTKEKSRCQGKGHPSGWLASKPGQIGKTEGAEIDSQLLQLYLRYEGGQVTCHEMVLADFPSVRLWCPLSDEGVRVSKNLETLHFQWPRFNLKLVVSCVGREPTTP